MNWDTLTTTFLWQFKPEYRDIFLLPDDEEESVQGSSPPTVHDDSMVAVSTLIDVNLNKLVSDVKGELETPPDAGFGVLREGKLYLPSLSTSPVRCLPPLDMHLYRSKDSGFDGSRDSTAVSTIDTTPYDPGSLTLASPV